jgi:uncharacterized membrane protein
MATWPRQKTGGRPNADGDASPQPDPALDAADAHEPVTAVDAEQGRAGAEPSGSADASEDDLGDGTGLDLDRSIRRGSLPHASELDGYEKAVPGAGDRLLSMVEASQKAHTKALEAEIKSAKRSQYIALLLVMLGFAASVVFFVLGSTVAGIIYVGMTIVVLLRLPSSYRARAPDIRSGSPG